MLNIRSTLAASRTLKRRLLKWPTSSLFGRHRRAGGRSARLVDAISSTIDERGEVLDSASSKLAKIRADLRTVRPYPGQAPAPAQLQPQPVAARTLFR
ncbi:MAG: hypothetical protein R3D55_07970 [Chloroflexota bacterium]